MKGGIKVLVTGGRDFTDVYLVYAVLDRIHREEGISTIIQGGAGGADAIAHRWANVVDRPSETFNADWTFGPKGGPERNARMLREGNPDLVVAFPGGRGTANMVRQAKLAKVRTIIVLSESK